MNILSTPAASGAVDILSLLKLGPEAGAAIDVGVASFPPDIRFPDTGYSVHDQHEVSLILEGETEIETPDGVTTVRAGDIVHLEPGEQHAAIARTPTRVFYILYGAPTEPAADAQKG